MFDTWRKKWLKKRAARSGPARPWPYQTVFEELETRCLFTVRTWSGLGINPNWSTGANWVGGIPPVADDDLVFPDGAQQFSNTNDFAAGTPFNSLGFLGFFFSGTGYVIGGNRIALGQGGIRSFESFSFSVSHLVRTDLSLAATRTVNVPGLASLELGGAISGAGGLTKEGFGSLLFTGFSANTYLGATVVLEGNLQLAKSPGATAVAGALSIFDRVTLREHDQIADDSSVTIRSGSLDFYTPSFSDTIGSLTMTGGSVFTGGGTLRLNGDVTAAAAGPTTPARIFGRLDLGAATRTFTVLAGGFNEGLIINATLRGDAGVGLTKAGPGTLALDSFDGNTYTGPTRVHEGTLQVGSFLGGNRMIRSPLIIGDDVGGPGADRVLIAGPDQIADNAPVTINSSGQLEFGGPYGSSFSDTIGSLTMTGGVVNTNEGTLRLASNVTAARAGIQPAVLRGNLALGSASRTFNVAGTGSDVDLFLNAAISGEGSAGLIKAGPGTLALTGSQSNTYAGATQVREGALELSKLSGATAIAGPLVVGDGAGIAGSDRVRVTDPDQIGDDVAVTVNSSGQLEFQGPYPTGFSDTVGSLTMTAGMVATGINTLGLNGDVTATRAFAPSTIQGNLLLHSGPHVFTVALGTATVGLHIEAAISGSGVLIKDGPGGLNLASSGNTYTGPTGVVDGTLLVSGIQQTSPITVGRGAVLGGIGTVGQVTVQGTLSPGISPGILRTSRVDFTPGAAFQVELNGPAPGSGYDQVLSSGVVEGGGGTLTVTLGFQPTVGQSFRIVQTGGSRPSAFAGLADGTVFALNGKPFRITYDNQGVVLTRVQGATATAVISSVNPSVYGQAVTFTATVTSNTPNTDPLTGTVQFLDGTTVLGTATLNAAGQASFTTTTPLPVGGRSITAVYQGSTDYAGSTSAALTQNVQQAATVTFAPISFANPSVYGQLVTFLAVVNVTSPGASTPTGTVTFRDGATVLGTAPVFGGFAVFTTDDLSVGSHAITAEYSGDTNLLGSTSAMTMQTVNAAPTRTILLTSENPSQVGQAVTFTALTLVPAPGAGVPTGAVVFFDGADLLGVATVDKNGTASLQTGSLSAGDHVIVAVYLGDENYDLSFAFLIQSVASGGAPGGGSGPGGAPGRSGDSPVSPDAAAQLQRASVAPAQPAAAQVAASLEGLVQRYYQKQFGRQAEPAEIQDWVGRLERGDVGEDFITALVELPDDLPLAL